MGNRAVVTFDPKPNLSSIGIYLHWNGGPESVYAFLDAMDHYHIPDFGGDDVARFAQIVGNFMKGNSSLSIGKLGDLDITGNHGLYIVTRGWKDGKYTRKVRRSLDGLRSFLTDRQVAKEYKTAMKSAYHTSTSQPTITALIRKANDRFFPKKFRF